MYDAVNEVIAPGTRTIPTWWSSAVRKLLSDKYFPIINNADDNQNKLAGQVLVSQKQIGGLKAVRVPFFPEDKLLITKISNLSIYPQTGARRRYIEDEPKRNRIVNYESSNDAYVVEDYDCTALVENIVIGPKPVCRRLRGSMTSPARRHRERKLAALQGAANLVRPDARQRLRAPADAAGRAPPHPQRHPKHRAQD